MLNKFLILLALYGLSIAAVANELKINPDNPGTYTVVKGDTLWDISARFLEQPWRWPEIWNVNLQIANPNLIYPGDVISLSYRDGRPVLNVVRGGGQQVSGRNVKLSPQIRSADNVNAIKTIPVDVIQQFLERPLVFEDDALEHLPYVVSSYDQHLIAATGNTIYVRGIPEENDNTRYSIYRKGEPYQDPKAALVGKEIILGYEAIYVGDATIERLGDPASAIITSVDREVLTGDRLIAQSNEDISSEFIPTPTDSEVDGHILSVVDGVSQIGQYQIIVLNLGDDQGVVPGNVLGIYQSGKVVTDSIGPNLKGHDARKPSFSRRTYADGARRAAAWARFLLELANAVGSPVDTFDETFPLIANKQAKREKVTLPEEYVGVAMVFRTFNKISYALVMETQGAVHVLDTVKSL